MTRRTTLIDVVTVTTVVVIVQHRTTLIISTQATSYSGSGVVVGAIPAGATWIVARTGGGLSGAFGRPTA